MAKISNVADVVVTAESSRISRANFGNIIFVSETPTFTPEFTREYADIVEVEVDFADTTDVWKAANAAFAQQPSVDKFIVGRKLVADSWSVALGKITDERDDWYVLTISSTADADITAADTFVETRKKIFIASSSDTDILNAADTTNIAYVTKTALKERVSVQYHETPLTEFFMTAWPGRIIPRGDPGRITWRTLRGLVGITPSVLTSAQENAATGFNANIYVPIGSTGKTMVTRGTMANGAFIDTVVARDYIEATIGEDFVLFFSNVDTVDYTEAGYATVDTTLRASLQRMVDSGLLASYVVDMPARADAAPADVSDRIVREITFSAVGTGAIHELKIRGKVVF